MKQAGNLKKRYLLRSALWYKSATQGTLNRITFAGNIKVVFL